MIGQLILPETATGDKSAVRIALHDDLTWHCPDLDWSRMLNDRFPGPGGAQVTESAGRFLLYRAAERLSARVELQG
ncbi:MAG: hypothetical protein AAGH92_03425 [Planctomycetota bacterium]